jgi:hypothetical protein
MVKKKLETELSTMLCDRLKKLYEEDFDKLLFNIDQNNKDIKVRMDEKSVDIVYADINNLITEKSDV